MNAPRCTCDECSPPSLLNRIERHLANPFVDTALAVFGGMAFVMLMVGVFG